ncbi:MAG: ATP-binding protein [Hyphomicrobiales bacterium]|nr:ATP-binding protein [Hyphomicrobiales bacterium]
MRARLLLAFFGISAFAVLAAAAGIYAFREVGGRLDVVDARIPPTLSALELSRSTERIIAAAPALLAATDRNRRDEIKAALVSEVGRLNARLADLKGDDAGLLPLLQIEPIVSSLTANLASLEDLVAGRLETSERIRTLRRGVFQTNDETQRLLAPWLEVTGSQIATLVEAREAGPTGPGDQPRRLASLIELQRLMRTAQAQVSALADMLAEASTTDQPRRLPILAFQLGLALRDLEATAAGLDPKLRPLFLEQAAKLREFAEGTNAIAEARKQELALVGEGERLLTETGRLSAQLTAAVDQLGSAAKRDIGEAIRDALSVQRLSTRALVVVVALSLLSSVLIVWLYVGGNIVRRLTALSDGMLAIAGGGLHTPVAVEGADEIGAMGRAVEIFRQNTLERDGLLAEKAQAADRLEKEVKQRTAEVEEKSRQLEIANKYKSHFLASASHDLRQPLHALTLFVAQLRTESDPEERNRLVARINAAVGSMNELFEALLDMSKLEAGALELNLSEFPIEPLLTRMETTFAEAALEKGLRLGVVPNSAWVRSDFILLERILLNLVSNAVHYTTHGGVVVGCRRRGGRLRIDVCDSGAGIPEEQQRKIFGEFVQLAAPKLDRRGGLGLGLSIVDRLGRLLDHPIEVNSRVGRGSRFSITVPLSATRSEATEVPVPLATIADPARGKVIIVIDDDALVLDGMGGILRSWGCDVVTAESGETALAKLAAQRLKPDLIISDYRLANAKTGIGAIEQLRGELGAAIPAFLISGDTAPERLREASASGYHLLHKPVPPMRLRAMLNQLLKARDAADAAPTRPTRARAARHRAPRPQ